jgi:predicted signal transduction protein with EAL and GGDEF domain
MRAESAAIVDAVTALGRGLHMITTAEGVETEEQFALLRTAGVDQVQGYLFSHPCLTSQLVFDTCALPRRAGELRELMGSDHSRAAMQAAIPAVIVLSSQAPGCYQAADCSYDAETRDEGLMNSSHQGSAR